MPLAFMESAAATSRAARWRSARSGSRSDPRHGGSLRAFLSGVDNRTLRGEPRAGGAGGGDPGDPELPRCSRAGFRAYCRFARRGARPGLPGTIRRLPRSTATARPALRCSSRSRPGKTRRRRSSASCRGWRVPNRPPRRPCGVEDRPRRDSGPPRVALRATARRLSQSAYGGATSRRCGKTRTSR